MVHAERPSNSRTITVCSTRYSSLFSRCHFSHVSPAKGYWAFFHAFYCLNTVWTQLFLWSGKLLFCCFITIIKTKLVSRLIVFFLFVFSSLPVLCNENYFSNIYSFIYFELIKWCSLSITYSLEIVVVIQSMKLTYNMENIKVFGYRMIWDKYY